MADLDFDQIPAQEQMVDNWGQPTPWMQALWQRLTGQIKDQIAALNSAQGDLATAQAALSSQAATLSTQAATLTSQGSTLATTVSTLTTTVSDLSATSAALTTLAIDFSNQNAAVAAILVQIFTKTNQLMDWVAYLDTQVATPYGGTKPTHLS